MRSMPPAGGYHSLEPNLRQLGEGPETRATKWRRGTAGSNGFSRAFTRGPISTKLSAPGCAAQPIGLAVIPRGPAPLLPYPLLRGNNHASQSRVELSLTQVASLLDLTRLFFRSGGLQPMGRRITSARARLARSHPAPTAGSAGFRGPGALAQTHCACAQPGLDAQASFGSPPPCLVFSCRLFSLPFLPRTSGLQHPGVCGIPG